MWKTNKIKEKNDKQIVLSEELNVKSKDKDDYIQKLSNSVRQLKREMQQLKLRLEAKEERQKTGKIKESGCEIEVKNLTSMVSSMRKETDR